MKTQAMLKIEELRKDYQPEDQEYYVGEKLRFLLEQYPHTGKAIAETDKTIQGCIEELKKAAKGKGYVNPEQSDRIIAEYFQLDLSEQPKKSPQRSFGHIVNINDLLGM